MKYKWWAHLNEEGKKLYGDIFPNGIVPTKHMITELATLEDDNGNPVGKEDVYRIDWDILTEEQRKAWVHRVASKHKVPDAVIRKEFENLGFIPLRKRYTCGSGTNEIHLFI